MIFLDCSPVWQWSQAWKGLALFPRASPPREKCLVLWDHLQVHAYKSLLKKSKSSFLKLENAYSWNVSLRTERVTSGLKGYDRAHV